MKDNNLLTEIEQKNHKEVYEAACESIVLLKNDKTLPLQKKGKIALFGAGAVFTYNGGTGSGEVHSRYDVSIKEGLENAGFEITSASWLNDYILNCAQYVKKKKRSNYFDRF